jgi:ketosteroid isomerase-like protein
VTNAETEAILRAAYTAFNARDIEAALELMDPEVDWPNAWEGGRVVGREAVAAYWTRQFDSISSRVEPESFDHEPDGSVTVTVRQMVRDTSTNELQSDTHVRHRYRLEDGLVVRMEVTGSVGAVAEQAQDDSTIASRGGAHQRSGEYSPEGTDTDAE